MQSRQLRKLSSETPHPPNIQFCLTKTRPNNRNITIRMIPRILQKQSRNTKTLTRLTRPTDSSKLILLKQICQFKLILKRSKTENLLKKCLNITTQRRNLTRQLNFKLHYGTIQIPTMTPIGTSIKSSCSS